MLPSKLFSTLSLAVLLSSLTTAKPVGTRFAAPVLAQSAAPTTFPVPNTVPQGTSIRIDGSSSMATLNETFKQRFESQFSGSTVTVNYAGTAAALQALSDGKIDLAAIGRPLTADEKAQGLVAVPLNRGKIAVIVGTENPFTSSLTVPQFIQIVRGEITDWSQVGGEPRPIRFLDRPDLSDTRAALSTYAVFQNAPYQPGTTATRLGEDSTRTVIEQLGRDGISFAPANQVINQPNVRALPLYNTLPDDPRYPFSQPYFYVYKRTPSPAVSAFLGFATAPDQLLSTFQPTEAAINAGSSSSAPTPGSSPTAPTPGSSPTSSLNAPASPASPAPPASPNATAPTSPSVTSPTPAPLGIAPDTSTASTPTPPTDASLPAWLWWLLPLGMGALLLGLLWRGRRSQRTAPLLAPDAPPPPPPVGPSAFAPARPEPDLVTRAGTVISSDRAAIRETTPAVQPANLAAEPVISSIDIPEASIETPQLAETPPEIPAASTSETLPGAAILGGAALAAGAAAAGMRYRSGESPQTAELTQAEPDEPLATFDLIEDLDVLESQLTDANAIELNLDDAPSTIDTPELVNETVTLDAEETPELLDLDAVPSAIDPSEAVDQTVIETDLDTSEAEAPIELNLDAVESIADEHNRTGAIAAMTALGGAGLAAVGFAGLPNSASEDPAFNAADAAPEFNSEESSSLSENLDNFEGRLEGSTEATSTEPQINSELAIDTPFQELEIPDASPNGTSTEPPIHSELANHPPSEVPSGIPGHEAGMVLGGAALAAGVAGISALTHDDAQTDVEAAKFDVGQTDLSSEMLATVDEGLPHLPDGYGESRLVLMPRDPQWAYAYWDIPNEHKAELRRQGGQNLVLRLADVTDLESHSQSPHSLQQYDCDEMARDWYLPIPVSDRDYLVEIGYLTSEGHWLELARSHPIRIPPVYPSDWFDEQFATINWEDDLQGKTFGQLVSPRQTTAGTSEIYDRLFALTEGAESQRVVGSLFGSMHQVPETAISSYVFPSGMGLWALPTPSGMGMSGMNLSGVGFSPAAVPIRPRKFWLVADAELIVYGATEPDATLTIAGQSIPLNPDGTFRFQMSFQDGLIDYPIMAVAADGEQTRSIHLKFTRETPKRNTNRKEDAIDEWHS